MEKINVVILSDDLDLRIDVKNLLDENKFAVSGYSGFGAEAKTKIINLFPDVVLCAVRGKVNESVFSFAQDILSTIHGTMIVLASDSIDIRVVNTAASYGIRKVIPFCDITAGEFSQELENVFRLEQQRFLDTNESKKIRCKVLGFFSGKGGTGKTTVAVNTAAALSKAGKRVIFLDLDLQFGDAAISLDANTKYSIVDLVQDRGGITIENINSFAMDHSCGMRILCAPKSSEFAEYVKPEHVEKIIDILRPYYEYVLIDMSSAFSDISITACENCAEIYMVYNTDILSLQNAKMCYDILDRLHQKDKLRIIINKQEKGLIRPSDFSKMFDTDIYCVIPYDGHTAVTSINKGIPAVLGQPRSALANSVCRMADRIIAEHSGVEVLAEPVKKKKKFIGK